MEVMLRVKPIQKLTITQPVFRLLITQALMNTKSIGGTVARAQL